jgi:hypothetical protein
MAGAPAGVGTIAAIEAGATAAGGAWTGTSWPVVQYRGLTVTR